MCGKIVPDDPFELKYCHDKYKTQKICNKAVYDFLPTLKFVLGWFVTSKMIKKLLTALYEDNNILDLNEDSDDVIFSFNEMGIPGTDFNNINLDDATFDEDDPETIFHIRLLA